MQKKLLLILLSMPALLLGKITESSSFSDILKYVENETLVVCDIDNTLIESTRQLGSNQWGEYLIHQLRSSGKSTLEALAIEGKIWRKASPSITMQLVDPETARVIDDLQSRQIHVIGLTARHGNGSAITEEQLQSVRIDLTKNEIVKEKIQIPFRIPAIYENGILYCSTSNTKSAVLTAFLAKTEYQPKRIVFIDDKLSHVQDLEETFKESPIEYIGIRFSGADARVKAFNPEIAEIQYEALPKIISDKEAMRMIDAAKQAEITPQLVP